LPGSSSLAQFERLVLPSNLQKTETVERKEARRVKLWLSELDVPEWQELAGDRLGWRHMLKSTKIRT
jgi:hypothetical protein